MAPDSAAPTAPPPSRADDELTHLIADLATDLVNLVRRALADASVLDAECLASTIVGDLRQLVNLAPGTTSADPLTLLVATIGARLHDNPEPAGAGLLAALAAVAPAPVATAAAALLADLPTGTCLPPWTEGLGRSRPVAAWATTQPNTATQPSTATRPNTATQPSATSQPSATGQPSASAPSTRRPAARAGIDWAGPGSIPSAETTRRSTPGGRVVLAIGFAVGADTDADTNTDTDSDETGAIDHVLVATVDHSAGGILADLWVSDRAAELVAGLLANGPLLGQPSAGHPDCHAEDADRPLFRCQPVAQVLDELAHALEQTERLGEPPIGLRRPESAGLHALLAARLRQAGPRASR